MPAGEFRFKRFTVRNRLSAMKVNTDGVLLGASMTVSGKAASLLDIGTGTGTIALMASQRMSAVSGKFMVTGIDIDPGSAAEAEENFRDSPWSDSLQAVCSSLSLYASGHRDTETDHIFSNPPYYGGDLKSPDARRCNARHADSLSWAEIVDFAEKSLSGHGHLSLILPADQETMLTRYAAARGLYPFRILRIRTVPRKMPGRIVAEFSRARTEVAFSTLTIQEAGAYTPEYRSLLHDFLTIF